MDIWETLYQQAKKHYHPKDVSPFLYAHHVVCALEAENGEIYTGFCVESCSGVLDLCAERVAALNMYVNSGQTTVKRLIAFRDRAPLWRRQRDALRRLPGVFHAAFSEKSGHGNHGRL